MDALRIELVGEADLDELLPLMRGYCDFYGVSPSDDALLSLSRALIADPEHEGLQLIARDAAGRAVMNDLFVAAAARGQGVADALIEACAERCRVRGVPTLGWQTAKDNRRAQAVYERLGAVRDEWLDYSLEVGAASPGATRPDS